MTPPCHRPALTRIPHMEKIEDLYRFVGFDHPAPFRDFDVFACDEIYPQIKPNFPIHKRNFYMIFLLKDLQEGMMIINDREVRDIRNVLLFLGPDHLFGGIRGDAMEGYIVLFSSSFLRDMKKNIPLEYPFFDTARSNIYELSPSREADYYELFGCLHQESGNRDVSTYLLLSILEKSQWLEGTHRDFKKYSGGDDELIGDFKRMIPRHMAEEHTVGFYAEQLNISSNYLNERVKSITGRTAKNHINERLIFEAKNILLYSDMSITEIAYSLGFSDNSYFCRFFKKNTGISPGEFRTGRGL